MSPEQAEQGGHAFLGTGVKQEVSPHRQRSAAAQAEQAYEYAVKSQTHQWVVLLQHRATESILDGFEGVGDAFPSLDADTLNGPPMVGCSVCEQAFEPALRRRRCPGEPR